MLGLILTLGQSWILVYNLNLVCTWAKLRGTTAASLWALIKEKSYVATADSEED